MVVLASPAKSACATGQARASAVKIPEKILFE